MAKPELHVLFRAVTGTRKTGPIAASYSGDSTCPDACPLKAKGCYAKGIRTREPWDRASNRGKGTMPWKQFLVHVRAIERGRLFRHNIAGDLPGDNGKVNRTMLKGLVAAARHVRGFTYTHKPVFGTAFKANREAIRDANRDGFTINLSANNLAHADRLADLGIGPVVTILPADAPEKLLTPAGRVVQVCPEVTGKLPNCAACGACASATRRAIIGFPANGIHEDAADSIARS